MDNVLFAFASKKDNKVFLSVSSGLSEPVGALIGWLRLIMFM